MLGHRFVPIAHRPRHGGAGARGRAGGGTGSQTQAGRGLFPSLRRRPAVIECRGLGHFSAPGRVGGIDLTGVPPDSSVASCIRQALRSITVRAAQRTVCWPIRHGRVRSHQVRGRRVPAQHSPRLGVREARDRTATPRVVTMEWRDTGVTSATPCNCLGVAGAGRGHGGIIIAGERNCGGRRMRPFGIALVVPLLALALASGCSWIAVKPPPASPPSDGKIDCTTSRAAPLRTR